MDDNIDAAADASQGLIDGVVNYFIDKVMESFNISATHVHARAAAHSLQALEYLDIFGIIFNVCLNHVNLR
jgi:hypothetical protein